MDPITLLFYAAIIAGLLVAFSLGANDVANAMAPAVGAKAITIGQAVLIAAVSELSTLPAMRMLSSSALLFAIALASPVCLCRFQEIP